MKAPICTHSSMMQSDLLYTIDQLLNSRPCNYIVPPLSLPQRKVLSERHLRSVSRVGSNRDPKSKSIGIPCCRRSRAIRIGSRQSPSPLTASRSSLALTTRPSGSGTPRLGRRCRRSRAIRVGSGQSPSPLTASRSSLALAPRPSGSGTPRLGRRCRRSRAIPVRSRQSPSLLTVNYCQF
jgi:hypothetical protein